MTPVERAIYFYRVDVGTDEAGRPLHFDPTSLLARVARLPWNASVTGRYWNDASDGKVTCCWVDRNKAPHRVRVGNIRRSALPELEEGGQLLPLNIPHGSGIAELIHVVFFKDNVAGADFNFYGPRISRLGSYLQCKAGQACPRVLQFQPLLKHDVERQLQQLQEIRLLTLAVRPSWLSRMTQANESLSDAFSAAHQLLDDPNGVVTITLKTPRYSRGWLPDKVLTYAKDIVRTPGWRDGLERFRVKGYNPNAARIEELDLLNDKLIAKRTILRQDDRSRALDPDSAYAAIESAYEELKSEIALAAAVSICES